MGNKGGFSELSEGWTDPGNGHFEIWSIVPVCCVAGIISVGIQKS